MKRLILAAALLAAAGAARSQGRPPLPRPPPPPPPPVMAAPGLPPHTVRVEGDQLLYERLRTELVTEKRTEKAEIDGKAVEREVTVYVPRTRKERVAVALDQVKAFGGDGKPVAADDL